MPESFIVVPNKNKKAENHPDYRVLVKDQEGKWQEWGAGWKKQGKEGNTFLSCQKSKPRPESPKVAAESDSAIPF